MKYTPRAIVAWVDIHERIELADRANGIDDMAASQASRKDLRPFLVRMRENL